MTRVVCPFVLASILLAAPARAQTPAAVDTPMVEVPGVTVTGLRGHEPILDVPAATFILPKVELRRSGVARLSSLLGNLPGLYAARQTSNGDPSVVDPRGFTANGESSYLKLLINGRDVRDAENGDVDWDWVLPEDVERVEVIQGAGAWAYGDASEGGIVNIVRPDPAAGFNSDCGVRAGSFGLVSGGIGVSGSSGEWGGALRGGGRGVSGWRHHSREQVVNGGAEARRSFGRVQLSLDTSLLDADRQDPGTLTAAQLVQDREQSETPTDYRHAKRGVGGLRLQGDDGQGGGWSVSPYARIENVDQIRTLFFKPLFHDTRGRTYGGQAEWRRGLGAARRMVFTATAEGEQTRLDSRYRAFSQAAGVDTLRENVESRKTTWAGSLGLRAQLDPYTVARASVRGDIARILAEDRVLVTRHNPRTLRALSPMLAISTHLFGHSSVYLSGSSAFRVPTLNQLYDRRPIDVDYPFPFTAYLSNPNLDPQRSINVEFGGRWEGDDAWATLTLYSTRVENEIDFDLATLSYANINKSWHRGVLAAAQGPLGGGISLLLSGTWSPTTFRGGPNDGKQINGVPIGMIYGALRWSPVPEWNLETGVRTAGKQFLDKQEQNPLPAFGTLEAAVSGHVGRLRGTVRGTNLLDHKYSDTGYIGALGEERFSPAAPRALSVSLSLD